jgi:hypothetical protein
MIADRIEKIILLALSILALCEGLRIIWGHQSTFGATYAGGYLILLGLLIGGLGVYSRVGGASKGSELPKERLKKDSLPKRVLLCLGILGGTVVLIPWLGYMLSTIIFFLVHLRVLGGYRWAPALVWAVGLGILFAYVFAIAGMMLPQGPIPWP